MANPLPAQTFNVLADFDKSDGELPQPPVQGVDGNLYGAAEDGGTSGAGLVYKLTPDGTLSTLYRFCSQPNCVDGQFPFGPLVLAPDGNLYGTTLYGGSTNANTGITGSGTVFKLSLQGELTTVYNFCSQPNCADGTLPNGLLLGSDGNFYGTTMGGGANHSGTIFKLTVQGALTVLHNFCSQPNCADGHDLDESLGAIVEGTDGNFYGLTDQGGSDSSDPYGSGTAFKITPEGEFTTLYTFCSKRNCADGAEPLWLIQAADGYFYGVAAFGGLPTPTGGTVFRLNTKGELATVYSFCLELGCTDGIAPGWLIQGAGAGNFYGTTSSGGSGTKCPYGCGTVFQIDASGTFESLHSFNAVEGINPIGLFQSTNGVFYGVTSSGGSQGEGTAYSLSMGLAPFVELLPTSGKVASEVLILGTDLSGTTKVSFNGAPAKFTAVSATEIAAIVPSGATTGSIRVTTPNGTLRSNVAFRIKP
jgi:uncharacterized repeat protein (TIGR03803 family)